MTASHDHETPPVAGSASIWVLGLVAGPRRTARVLHTGRDAAYLDLDGTCLAVLGARAVQVPCGIRTALPALPEIAPRSRAVITHGTIELAGPRAGSRVRVLVGDIVDTTVPVLTGQAANRAGCDLEELAGDRLDAVRALLPATALTALAESDPDAVGSLLGLGPGLTPLGDDVLAGWLAAAVSSRHPALPRVRDAVTAGAARSTTTLSATLLTCAARGEAIPELRSLLAGIARGNADGVAQSLKLLLRIGDTSGAGLVLGALLALQSPSLLARSPIEEGAAG